MSLVVGNASQIRIGTRSSSLAFKQVEYTRNLVREKIGAELEVHPITTTGDRIKDKSLIEFGGKGLFVKEIEEALISGRIDIACHSAKDLPSVLNSQTKIAAFLKRGDSRDCFVSAKYKTIGDLPKGAKVGTCSPRRTSFLLNIRPDLEVVHLRGNVDTRIRKILNADELDAAIFAACGLIRIGQFDRADLNYEMLDHDKMIPCAGQASIAIQVRNNDVRMIEMFKNIDDYETRVCVEAERLFLEQIGASCMTPVGSLCTFKNSEIHFRTSILSSDGKSQFKTDAKEIVTDLSDIGQLALSLAHNSAMRTKSEAPDLLSQIIL